jgi:hypothetical protein
VVTVECTVVWQCVAVHSGSCTHCKLQAACAGLCQQKAHQLAERLVLQRQPQLEGTRCPAAVAGAASVSRTGTTSHRVTSQKLFVYIVIVSKC